MFIVRRAFTLVELLVAISIVVTVLGASLVAFNSSKAVGRDGKRKADLEGIRSALELYRNDCGSYPVATYTNNWPAQLTGVPVVCAGNVYMSSIPKDPVSTQNYYYTSAGTIYTLCASVELGGGVVAGCGSCGVVACNYKTANP